MPEFLDILSEEYERNVGLIGELCARRQSLQDTFESLFSKCRSLDQMLSLELSFRAQAESIDNNITALSLGSRKLLDQMRVAS